VDDSLSNRAFGQPRLFTYKYAREGGYQPFSFAGLLGKFMALLRFENIY